MTNHFEVERPSLPAIALTTDSCMLTASIEEGYVDQIFARQIHALGKENDVLIVLTTRAHSDALYHAITAAKERQWISFY